MYKKLLTLRPYCGLNSAFGTGGHMRYGCWPSYYEKPRRKVMKAKGLPIFVAIMISLSNVSTTQAISYVFTPISYPGATETGVIGLNDLSQVQAVGEVYLPPPSYIRGFIYQEGGFAPLFNVAVPGATHTTLNDINNAGKMVGHYDLSDITGFKSLGFLYADGVHTDIVPPGGTDTQANSINNSDIIVGETTIDGKQRGFIYDRGTYTFLDYHKDDVWADGTRALGISDKGTIVGLYSKDGIEHGFIFSEGTYTPLDVTVPKVSITPAKLWDSPPTPMVPLTDSSIMRESSHPWSSQDVAVRRFSI